MRRTNLINVVDLEATCERGNPRGWQSEIIEIGICTLDLQTLELANKTSLIVRPVVSYVTPFCTELTSLTQADVDSGMSLKEAFDRIKRDFNSKAETWASYGAYDRKMVERECRAKGLEYPFGDDHWNVKSMYARLNGLDREVGMAQALEIAGIPLEGKHHRGDDDSWNIGKLLRKVILTFRTNVN